MLKVVKISRMYVNDCPKGSDVPYAYKTGKFIGQHYQRVTIKTEQTGDDVYATNTFPDSKITKLEVGKEYLLDLEEKDGFKNFRFPTQAEQSAWDAAIGQA